MSFSASSPVVGRTLVLSALAQSLVREGAKAVWIDVAFEGEWHGHPSGSFELSREIFERVIANHGANPNKKIPLDYEHQSERGGEAPAAGWVDRFELRTGTDGKVHLWAHAELTDRATAQIDAGEYRFSSGVFDFGARDFVTGEPIGCQVPSVALTNTPFIRGAEPIRLTARKAMTGGSMSKVDIAALIKGLKNFDGEQIGLEQVQALFTLLGSGDSAAAEEAASEMPVETAAAPVAPVTASAPAITAATPPAGPVETAAPGDTIAEASAALGVSPEELGALVLANLEAIKALASGEASEPGEPGAAPAGDMALSASSARVLRHQLDAVTAQRNLLLTEKVARVEAEKVALGVKADAEVEHLIVTGTILATARDDFRQIYINDPASFARIAATLKPIIPVGSHASAIKPPTTKTPAVAEDDEEIKGLRRYLKAAGIPETTIEQKVRERIALRAGATA